MKIKRKLIHNSKNSRSLMLPLMWFESHRLDGHEIEYVFLDMQENGTIVITPVINEK